MEYVSIAATPAIGLLNARARRRRKAGEWRMDYATKLDFIGWTLDSVIRSVFLGWALDCVIEGASASGE